MQTACIHKILCKKLQPNLIIRRNSGKEIKKSGMCPGFYVAFT